MKTRLLAVAALSFAFASGMLAPASAANFQASPLTLMLGRGVKSQAITITNTSTEPLRVEIAPKVWAQSSDGHELTNPTDDLVVFPSLLQIPPGEQRSVRVGLLHVTHEPVEKTYRLYLTELPSRAATLARNSVTIDARLRLSVPVFIAPLKSAAKPGFVFDGVRAGHLSLRLVNEGSEHYLAKHVDVQGRDEHGAQLFDKSLAAWYVLAGGDRTYDVPLSSVECGRLHSLHVVVETETTTFSRDFASGGPSCR